MELGMTENSEIIFIHTDDLEVTIKGGANGETPPFVMPNQMESSVAITCNVGFIPSVRGKAEVVSNAVFAGKWTATISCDPLFFEQTSYTLIAQANEGHKLEFDRDYANLRKSITRFGCKGHVLSCILNFRNEIGMPNLIFNFPSNFSRLYENYIRILRLRRT